MNRFLLTLFIAITLTAIRAQSRVTFYTNFGQFNAELYDSIKPITAGNFIQLADSGFYDGEEFYRVWDGFVIQGGSFWGSGTIIPDEFDSTGTLSNVKHTLSMANAGPNTGTSEFFINLKNNTFLDWNKAPLTSAHPVFGLVKDGWNIVDSIAKTPVIDSNKRPITPVVIDSIRVTGSYISVETIELMRTATAIYPNPVTQQTILDIYAPKNQVASVLICDALGRVISDIEIELTAGKSKIPLYTLLSQPLPTGIYLVHIQQESSLFTERILVE